MAYNPINLGNQPNDGLGDGGRTGGEKINGMFREIYETVFTNGRWIIKRWVLNVGNTNLTALRVDDHIAGWYDTGVKDRWIEGIILDASVNLPAEIDDQSKFLKTVDKAKTN